MAKAAWVLVALAVGGWASSGALAQISPDDALLWDVDASGALSAGDLVLSGRGAGRLVAAGDARLGEKVENASFAPLVEDLDGSGAFDVGDVVVHDADADGVVSPGDVRYGGGAFGVVVTAQDRDAGFALLDARLWLVAPKPGTPGASAYLSPSDAVVAPGALRMAPFGQASAGTQVRDGDPDQGVPVGILGGRPAVLRAQAVQPTPPPTTTPTTVPTPSTAPPAVTAGETGGGVPAWVPITLGGAVVVGAGGGATALAARVGKARWQREAEEGEPGGSCVLGARPKAYKARLDPQWKDVDLSLTKVVSMTLTPLAGDGAEGEAEDLDEDALDALNGAIARRLAGATREDLLADLEPLALEVARAARQRAKSRGATSDVRVEVDLEASKVPFGIKLCRCEPGPDGPRWTEKKSWTATLKDERKGVHVATLRRVAPPGRARDEPLARVVAPVLARFAEETSPFFAGGLGLEIEDDDA